MQFNVITHCAYYIHDNTDGDHSTKCQMIIACAHYYCGVLRSVILRSATLSQVVAAHMQLDVLLFMHMKCCLGSDNSKIMLSHFGEPLRSGWHIEYIVNSR